MTKGELISQIAAEGQVKKADVERTLNAFIKTMTGHFAKSGARFIGRFWHFYSNRQKRT